LQNGKFFGHNSDADGFIKNFYNHCPNYQLSHKKCLVIGAGGASRAIVYSLISQKVAKIFIANRDHEKTLKLIEDFKNFSQQNLVELEFVPLKKNFDFLPEIDLIINSTSLGMINQSKLDIDISNAKKSAIIYDIVYKPLITDILKQAETLNLKIITGIGMLIEQALIGFEAWFKIKAEFDLELEKILLKNC
jgi:shikimate dehydrogenase